MTMREEFEQQMRAENACTRLERQQDAVGGQYRTISVERAWKRFQAAYAAGQRAEREEIAKALEMSAADLVSDTHPDAALSVRLYRRVAGIVRNRKEQD